MKSRRVAVNGVHLHVSEWAGEPPAVVFAHPTGFLGAIWRPIIERLRSRGLRWRMIAFDWRGHGLSSKPDTGYEWDILVDDIQALAAELGVSAVVAVGHSAGATTLAGAAARDPGFACRLLLIDPILFHLRPHSKSDRRSRMAARTRTRRLVWGSRDEIYASFRVRPPYDTWTAEALRGYIEAGTFERPDGEVELLCPGRIEAQIYENADGVDSFGWLSRVAAPTLIVRGEHSDSFDRDRATEALRRLKDGRLVTVPETTHYVPMEMPDRIVDIVLAECEARGYTEAS